MTEWFENWFDSHYYHILYQHRDDQEARRFMGNLLAHLAPKPVSTILDLACGKGRHAIFLAGFGHEVTGLDLSKESIQAARASETDLLSFYEHDMRKPFRPRYFDYIFNLFTSFGYFETDKEHRQTLENIAQGLKSKGQFVMDFFNAEKVKASLVASEEKTLNNVHFKINRRFENGCIYKHIAFEDQGKSYAFEERVRAFTKADLEKLFEKAGLKIQAVFGNYDLEAFDVQDSPRLILLAQKND